MTQKEAEKKEKPIKKFIPGECLICFAKPRYIEFTFNNNQKMKCEICEPDWLKLEDNIPVKKAHQWFVQLVPQLISQVLENYQWSEEYKAEQIKKYESLKVVHCEKIK